MGAFWICSGQTVCWTCRALSFLDRVQSARILNWHPERRRFLRWAFSLPLLQQSLWGNVLVWLPCWDLLGLCRFLACHLVWWLSPYYWPSPRAHALSQPHWVPPYGLVRSLLVTLVLLGPYVVGGLLVWHFCPTWCGVRHPWCIPVLGKHQHSRLWCTFR